MDRRTYLRVSSATLLGGLAGCSGESSDSSMFHFRLVNQTSDPYSVSLAIFQMESGQSRKEATVLDEFIEIEPQETVKRENIGDPRQYLLRYTLSAADGERIDHGHFHYYPQNDGYDETIVLHLFPSGEITRSPL